MPVHRLLTASALLTLVSLVPIAPPLTAADAAPDACPSMGLARAWYRHAQAGVGVTGVVDTAHPPQSSLPSHDLGAAAPRPALARPAPVEEGLARAWRRQPEAGPGVTGPRVNDRVPPNTARPTRS